MKSAIEESLEIFDIECVESKTKNWSIHERTYEIIKSPEALPHFENFEADIKAMETFMK